MTNTNMPTDNELFVADRMARAYLAAPSRMEQRFRDLLEEYLGEILCSDFNARAVLREVETSNLTVRGACTRVLGG